MRYREEEVPLPTAVGAGLSASRRLEGSAVDQIGVFTALADGTYVIEEGKFEWRGGLEYRWQESLAIRVGASRPADRNSWEYSSGLGVEVGAYRLDYATRFQSAEGAPHIFGLTVSL